MNLSQLFNLSLQEHKHEPALEFYDRSGSLNTITFGELDRRGRRMAGVLESRGLRRGDRLCVYLANCVEMIELYLACTTLGVIFVPINILYKEREVAHILRDAEPFAVVVDGELPAAADTWQVTELAGTSEATPMAIDGDEPAAIIYTSGTTGVSKGAILTHNNFASNTLTLNTCWRICSADRMLLAVPLFHVHGLALMHCWLLSGCRMRLLERFEHQKAQQTFLDFRPTFFSGVPTLYVRLLELPEQVAREIGTFIRLFVSGSATAFAASGDNAWILLPGSPSDRVSKPPLPPGAAIAYGSPGTCDYQSFCDLEKDGLQYAGEDRKHMACRAAVNDSSRQQVFLNLTKRRARQPIDAHESARNFK